MVRGQPGRCSQRQLPSSQYMKKKSATGSRAWNSTPVTPAPLYRLGMSAAIARGRL